MAEAVAAGDYAQMMDSGKHSSEPGKCGAILAKTGAFGSVLLTLPWAIGY